MNKPFAAACGAVLLSICCTTSFAVARPDLAARLSATAVPFVANDGQWPGAAAFGAPIFAGALFVTSDGRLVYRLNGGSRDDKSRNAGWVLTETFLDGGTPSRTAVPRGEELQAGEVSFALGDDPRAHRSGLSTYGRIALGRVYPGIDVALRATALNVEKIFTVHPGSDPASIRIRLDGASPLSIGEAGGLVAATGNGPVSYTPPIAFQQRADGSRRDVAVSYALERGSDTYGFAVGEYDRALPLVIDPLPQATYAGGAGSEFPFAIAVHPATGEVYIAGQTSSTDFPGTIGGAQPASGTGPFDGFVAAANCTCGVRGFNALPALIDNGQSVYIRQYAPGVSPAGATARLLVGGGSASFFVSTATGGCSLDVDGNGAQDALTDGLILIRALFGLTGSSVTNNAIGGGASRNTWALIQPWLNGNCGGNFAP